MYAYDDDAERLLQMKMVMASNRRLQQNLFVTIVSLSYTFAT